MVTTKILLSFYYFINQLNNTMMSLSVEYKTNLASKGDLKYYNILYIIKIVLSVSY